MKLLSGRRIQVLESVQLAGVNLRFRTFLQDAGTGDGLFDGITDGDDAGPLNEAASAVPQGFQQGSCRFRPDIQSHPAPIIWAKSSSARPHYLILFRKTHGGFRAYEHDGVDIVPR